MKYITTAEAAEKWKISDRRVRKLCEEDRIPFVVKEDEAYYIPDNAEKPADRRFSRANRKPAYYLKWSDDVVGTIDEDYSVSFLQPEYNEVVRLYTDGSDSWNRQEFEAFLESRIADRGRRDIEKILFRCGLSAYDPLQIGIITHAVNAKDLLWVTASAEQPFSEAVTEVFESVFVNKADASGGSVDTPEGCNIKRYGVWNGKYGIFKRRLGPTLTDTESEIAVYKLAKRLGVPCCPVCRVDEDTVFSEFVYDFSKEYIVHFRHLLRGFRRDNEYLNLLSSRPQYQADFLKMLALDFLTRQDDRHLSNIAVKISTSGESFYPLYDNGRSLFYEDSEETAAKAVSDIKAFSTDFGPVGTYFDQIADSQKKGTDFSRLLDLSISDCEVSGILKDSGFHGYRLDAACEWFRKCLAMLREF